VRVVFDTNIFVSAFATNSSQAARAIDRVITGRDRLFISRPILFELSRVLATKFAHDPEQLARIAVFWPTSLNSWCRGRESAA
jgi:predicted nucleic acid-binding protein